MWNWFWDMSNMAFALWFLGLLVGTLLVWWFVGEYWYSGTEVKRLREREKYNAELTQAKLEAAKENIIQSRRELDKAREACEKYRKQLITPVCSVCLAPVTKKKRKPAKKK